MGTKFNITYPAGIWQEVKQYVLLKKAPTYFDLKNTQDIFTRS